MRIVLAFSTIYEKVCYYHVSSDNWNDLPEIGIIMHRISQLQSGIYFLLKMKRGDWLHTVFIDSCILIGYFWELNSRTWKFDKRNEAL